MRLDRPNAVCLRMLLLLALAAWICAAQDVQPYSRFYVGSIGAWDLRLSLEISVAQVRGRLRSSGVPGPLILVGEGMKQDRIDCQVSDDKERPLGRLQGRISDERTFSGSFKPVDGSAALPVSASEIAEMMRTEINQGPWLRVISFHPTFADATPLLTRLNQLIPEEVSRITKEFLGPSADRRNALAPMRLDCDLDMHHCSPQLVSLLASQYTFTGGAHGNTDYTSLTFAWLDGAPFRLDLWDLFTNPAAALKEIATCCAADLARQGASEAAKVPGKPVEFFRNFTVSRNGLSLAFAPYAVGAYAEGAFLVTIPWSRLTRFTDPAGALAEVLPSPPAAPETPTLGTAKKP